MKENIVKVLDAINRQGLDNSEWGIVSSEVSTKDYFGTRIDHKLSDFIYVWLDKEKEEYNTFYNLCPDYFLSIEDEPNEYIIIFKY